MLRTKERTNANMVGNIVSAKTATVEVFVFIKRYAICVLCVVEKVHVYTSDRELVVWSVKA
jgi:hypothetical protein